MVFKMWIRGKEYSVDGYMDGDSSVGIQAHFVLESLVQVEPMLDVEVDDWWDGNEPTHPYFDIEQLTDGELMDIDRAAIDSAPLDDFNLCVYNWALNEEIDSCYP